MIRIRSIDHIVLRTTKLDTMIGFYCDVLGCTVERQLDPAIGLVQLRAGTALIDLVSLDGELGRAGGGPAGITENNLDHFCLQLEKLSEEEIRGHLARHGIDAGEFQRRYGAQGFGQSVYIQDPEGNTVELRSEI